jgi:hypothetical protein
MAIVECPSISETTFGFTLRVSSGVAHVCRRSWKRISGKPARLSKGLKRWAVTCWRESGEPSLTPVSRHGDFLTGIAAGGSAVEVEDFEFAYALYAGDPSNGSSTTRVASFRLGRIGYREWATRSGRINPSVEDRLDHDVDELMA